MEITNRDVPRVEFTPLLPTNFDPVSVEIPKLSGGLAETQFSRILQITIQRACGELSCAPNVSLSTAKGVPDFSERILIGATFDCANGQCPLEGPPEAGDREPLNPAPTNPGLELEAALPAASIDSHV